MKKHKLTKDDCEIKELDYFHNHHVITDTDREIIKFMYFYMGAKYMEKSANVIDSDPTIHYEIRFKDKNHYPIDRFNIRPWFDYHRHFTFESMEFDEEIEITEKKIRYVWKDYKWEDIKNEEQND